MISAAYYRQAARLFLSERGVTRSSGGYVHFWQGKPCGWSASDRLHGHPNYYRPGVVAVPVDDSLPLLVSVGGDDDAGAESWEVRP